VSASDTRRVRPAFSWAAVWNQTVVLLSWTDGDSGWVQDVCFRHECVCIRHKKGEACIQLCNCLKSDSCLAFLDWWGQWVGSRCLLQTWMCLHQTQEGWGLHSAEQLSEIRQLFAFLDWWGKWVGSRCLLQTWMCLHQTQEGWGLHSAEQLSEIRQLFAFLDWWGKWVGSRCLLQTWMCLHQTQEGWGLHLAEQLSEIRQLICAWLRRVSRVFIIACVSASDTQGMNKNQHHSLSQQVWGVMYTDVHPNSVHHSGFPESKWVCSKVHISAHRCASPHIAAHHFRKDLKRVYVTFGGDEHWCAPN
jgi:GNAT superfamily N-acetyltransferase